MKHDGAILARDLVKRYRRRGADPVLALDGFSLDVPRGAWLALLGPNGSGKSTFLKSLTRAVTPDQGTLTVLGVDAGARDAEIRRRLAVVFQSPGLDRLLTVRENLATQCALFGWTGQEASRRIREHCEAVGLVDRLGDRVGSLSGGLTRRADLARALLSEPELLLLDEPTTGLDPEARSSFLDLIERTRAQRPALTIVMSTHLMDEADRCDSVALMASGRLLAHESPESLRAGLGDLALHTHARFADLLRDAGLEVRTEGNDAVASGEADSLARAAHALATAQATFSLKPPTLEDVYLAHAQRGGDA
ncbi:MAG: ABC transporter ATP-binding protein [Phycisphaerales bacterium]